MTGRLKEIKERLEKASQGPCEAERIAFSDGEFAYEIHDKHHLVAFYERNHKSPMKAKFNAELYAHAREDIPFLLSELEKVSAERDTLKAENRDFRRRLAPQLYQERDRLRAALEVAKKVIDYHAACAPKHLEEIGRIECGKE